MKLELTKILDVNMVHNSFFDKKTVETCMEKSYDLGAEEVLEWLSKMDYLSDNIEYIIEEWNDLNPKTKRKLNQSTTTPPPPPPSRIIREGEQPIKPKTKS